MLIDVADRIATVVRSGDVVARISGDYFVVLCERVDTETALVELAYSALTHLRKLPPTTIKMDRSFLDSIDASGCEATVRAVVALAGVHGIGVVAEGIETESARALVQSAGCERGQGYLFGRPGPLSDILPTLSARAFEPAGTSVPRG